MVQAVADLKVNLAGANAELAKNAKAYAASIKEQERLTGAIHAYVNVTGDASATAAEIATAYQELADASAEASDKHAELAEAQSKLSGGMLNTENMLDALIGMLNDSSGAATISKEPLIL